MNREVDYVLLFTIIPAALVITVFTFWIMRRMGKKRRWYDERHRVVLDKARSFSWIVTTVAMFIVWIIIVTFEGPGLSFFLMTGLWMTNAVSYGIGAAIAGSKN